ncbi:enoyl-CoA hydratase/isomerase family protein [Cryobacterium sp. Y62]|uniref:enoyl-CoA hydratase/isomerase family protein n=1 Tax=Cryobacterium sp. Y62 TaxID=2048284 RepID=UPI000CE5455D|nr:enoyl-CoA hydratase/isomerase family protein [Cryobacterium sp. Y62]
MLTESHAEASVRKRPPGTEHSPGSGIWLDIADGAATVTIARQEDGNRLPSIALNALADALETVQNTPDAGGLIVTSGTSIFCSGGVLYDDGSDFVSDRYEIAISRFFEAWTGRRFPIVTVVDGPATAFGCSIALSSDVVIATPRASFHLPELGGGVIPVYAIAMLEGRVPRRVMHTLVWSRRRLTPELGEHLGVVTELATLDGLAAAVDDYRRLFGTIPAAAARGTKELFENLAGRDAVGLRETAKQSLADVVDRIRSGASDQSYLEVTR